MKRKILHILVAPTTHIVNGILNNTMIYLNNDSVEHFFYLLEYNANIDAYKEFRETYQGVKMYNFNTPAELNQIIKETNEQDKVILHGFTLKRFWKSFFRLSKADLAKMTWVCWGTGSHWLKGRKGFFINHLRKYLFHRLGAIVALMRPNYEELIRDFKCTNVHLIPYYTKSFDFSDNDWFQGKPYISPNGRVKVKVGNSGWPINDHEASFRLLHKFKEDDIEIITPLSYGFEEHINYISSLGLEMFGEKYKPLLTMMPQREYTNFLSEGVDIMVYNARSQTGLFNLYCGLYAGKKLYISGYNYEWISSFGARIFHVDEIKNMTFNEFIAPLTSEEIQNNKSRLIEAVDVHNVLPKWKEVLEIT